MPGVRIVGVMQTLGGVRILGLEPILMGVRIVREDFRSGTGPVHQRSCKLRRVACVKQRLEQLPGRAPAVQVLAKPEIERSRRRRPGHFRTHPGQIGGKSWAMDFAAYFLAQYPPLPRLERSRMNQVPAIVNRPDGSRIAWRSTGQAEGPTIAFSNSLGANWSMWDAVVEALAEDYRILNYDTRGHGRSEAGSATATLADLAADLFAVMDAAEVERCDLVGLSLGGMTGLHAALRHPERIRRLVACNCRAQVDESGFKAWEDRIAALRAGGVKLLVRPTIERWFSGAFQAAQPQMMEQVRAMIAGNSERGYEACVRAIQGLNLQAELPHIALPVLYVAGAQDLGAPAAEMQRMAELTPGSRCEVLDPCGHIASMERSADLIGLLRGFLRGD